MASSPITSWQIVEETMETVTDFILGGSKITAGEGNGTPLHYSCLENPMGRGAWWAAVHGVSQSRTQLKRLSSSSCSRREKGFPHSSVGKSPACNAGDLGSIPDSGRSLGEGNGNPLQYSCLENPMDKGAWQAIVYGIARVGHNLATKPPPQRGKRWK